MQSKRILAAAVAPLFLGAISVLAAGEATPAAPAAAPAPPAVQPAKGEYTFTAAAGGSYMFETNIDEGGKFSRARAGLQLSLDTRCTDELLVQNRLTYTYDDYNFSDTSADPWTKVHTLIYAMLLDYKIDDTWTVFGGPLLGFAAEDGADWGESFIPGVAVGARYRFNPDLVVGLGVAGVQQIEGDFTVLPILLLDWRINDQITIRNSSPIPGVTQGWMGLEGIWNFADGWDAGIGAQIEKSRFRLSDGNDIPAAKGGVGQVTGVPIYARLDWKPNSQVTVSGFAGAIAGGELKLEDEDGHSLGDEVDYDPGVLIGATISFRQ